MKVLHICTSDKIGGAALACWRVAEALSKTDIDAKILVQRQTEHHPMLVNANPGAMKFRALYNEFYERFDFISKESNKHIRFYFSSGLVGQDISKHQAVQEADILHLHWVNKGFLSLRNLRQLASLNKPIVWTLHDMWAFTGGCHYSGGCEKYKTGCHNCWFLNSNTTHDLSNKVFEMKRRLYQYLEPKINFITPSVWLKSLAKDSALLSGFPFSSIPNTINTSIYKPGDKRALRYKLKLPRHKKLILFIAMNVSDKRKGFHFLKESLTSIGGPSQKFKEDIELLVLGKINKEELKDLPINAHYIRKTRNPQLIIDAYNASDLVAVTSQEDNFPNTILEALSCGRPVIAFRTGGIPEMVNHKKTGYLVEKGDTSGIVEGIRWILEDPEKYEYLCKAARQKALQEYDYAIISQKFQAMYKRLLEKASSISPSNY
ncbi:MAG: glycosyltransferase family 4 protein [Bacteroidota bacterium]